MAKTISQLWNGDLAPIQDLSTHNPELKALEPLIEHNLTTLTDHLSAPLRSLFQNYSDCIDEYFLLAREQAFCDGFSLGMKLLSEAFSVQNTPA